MIKRGCIFIMLALFCALAVLGTGFALWAFDTDKSTISSDLGVTITESSELGSFSMPEIKHVVLDGGTGAGINPTITGVTFYKSDENGNIITDNSLTISFTVKSEHLEEMNKDNNWDKVSFGIRINVPEQLKGIIDHTEFYSKHLGDNGYIDLKALVKELTDHFSDSDFSKSDFSYAPDAGVFTFKLTTTSLNRFFTYSAGQEPTTLPNYQNIGTNFAPLFTIDLWQGY